MKEVAERRTGLTELTCPHYQKDFSGYCEGCNQRGDCMLQTLLHKVESLETKIEDLRSIWLATNAKDRISVQSP